MMPIPPHALKTERLLLRPTCAGDADRAFEIQSDWEVTRMLRLASFPPAREEVDDWFAAHQLEWEAGHAYRFAVIIEENIIGLVDIDGIDGRQGTLGYWFDRAVWGRGLAFEAAHPVVRFAVEKTDIHQLRAGHAHDNPASRRILSKLGFSHLDIVERFSRPRNENILQWRYVKTLQRA